MAMTERKIKRANEIMQDWQKKLVHSNEKKRVTKETIERTVDQQTGEYLKERFVQDIYVDKEPNYIKLYIDNLILLNGLPKGTTDTIIELLKYMSYENTIVLNAYIKKTIADTLGFKTVQSLDNNLNKLVKKGVLERLGRGTYRANAFLFGKGDWNDIKQIRFEIIFGKNGIEQRAEFEYNEEVASDYED